jgi:hypothetical protein
MRLVLLLGMHRSGTSAATRALNLCGVPVPDDLLPPMPDNLDGFWEPRSVVLLHDQALEMAGLSWRDPRPFPPDWFEGPAAAAVRTRLWETIRPELQFKRRLVVKDPRLCRLLPLWRRICADNAVPLHCILTARNPLDVADSLHRRDAMQSADALLLWLRYVLEAERNSRGLPRGFMTYDQLMQEGAAAIRRAAAVADVVLAPDPAADDAVAAFLQSDRRHVQVSHAELEEAPAAPDWSKTAYTWLAQAAGGAKPPVAALDAVGEAMRSADLVYGPRLERAVALAKDQARELARLRQQADALRRERRRLAEALESMQDSPSWRVTAPLRLLGWVLNSHE